MLYQHGIYLVLMDFSTEIIDLSINGAPWEMVPGTMPVGPGVTFAPGVSIQISGQITLNYGATPFVYPVPVGNSRVVNIVVGGGGIIGPITVLSPKSLLILSAIISTLTAGLLTTLPDTFAFKIVMHSPPGF